MSPPSPRSRGEGIAMASQMALLSLLLVLFASSSSLVASESFDFYYFVLMWPGAYCAQSGCCLPTHGTVPANDFFVRGLMTYSSTTGNAVTKCSNTAFYINELNTLQPDIYEYWSNIKCPSNDGKSSWKSTWKTYGVCSGLDEVAYFTAALNLRAKIDVLSLLAKKGITPTYDVYNVSDIKSAIAEGIGAEPLIQCSKGPFSKFQLYQIYICVDKDASTIIECPYSQAFTCNDPILFHPFREWMMVEKNSSKLEMPVNGELSDV